MKSPPEKDKRALVLSGGGARASYQVGVLRAIASLLAKDALAKEAQILEFFRPC
jgi:predicted acylesterase/phospholipase RssA